VGTSLRQGRRFLRPAVPANKGQGERPRAVLVDAAQPAAKLIQRGSLMPRCPLCRSALVTITFGLYPIAICTSCNARWIQDGHQQRAISQIQEPSLMAGGRP
jgi:hypothetical protein